MIFNGVNIPNYTIYVTSLMYIYYTHFTYEVLLYVNLFSSM